jgi:hypothetical protein
MYVAMPETEEEEEEEEEEKVVAERLVLRMRDSDLSPPSRRILE